MLTLFSRNSRQWYPFPRGITRDNNSNKLGTFQVLARCLGKLSQTQTLDVQMTSN